MSEHEERINQLAAEVAQPSIPDGLFDEDADLGQLAVEHDRLRALESRCDVLKKEVSDKIIARMDALGVDSVKAGGRRLAFQRRKNYGVAEGQVELVKSFMEEFAPEVNVPASTNIKKAVDAYLDQTGATSTPPFISVTESRSLVNAKA